MLTLVSFVFFTGLVGVLTCFLVRGKESGSSEGYFLAGRFDDTTRVITNAIFIPIFSVVLVGMLDRRVPPWSANLALVLGFAIITLGYFALSSLDSCFAP